MAELWQEEQIDNSPDSQTKLNESEVTMVPIKGVTQVGTIPLSPTFDKRILSEK
jgi:hypothetical protein